MTPDEIRTLLQHTLTAWATHEEELRAADAALGDGDLGLTVRKGALAAAETLADDEGDLPISLRKAGQALATANPSTFAALVGGGVLAGAAVLEAKPSYDRTDALLFAVAVAQRIEQRGQAELGDKTVLDALLPSLEAFGRAQGEPVALVTAMLAVAQDKVTESAAWESRRGRAGWLGERSVGLPDAGAVAYVAFLTELLAQLEGNDA
ncbi:MAG: DAK2 domain-containing protein [Propioniciclava sp.]